MKTILAATLCLLGTTLALAQSTVLRVEAPSGYDVLSSTDQYTGTDGSIPDTLGGLRAGIAIGYDVPVART